MGAHGALWSSIWLLFALLWSPVEPYEGPLGFRLTLCGALWISFVSRLRSCEALWKSLGFRLGSCGALWSPMQLYLIPV